MELLISFGIVDSYFSKLKNNLKVDVAIVGGGPSGLVAGYYLAKKGIKVVLLERKLSPGGGMWGGAMMFNQIVVQKDTLPIINEFGISYSTCEEFLLIDSVHATSALIYKATQAGCTILNCISVEDVVIHENKISGLVINWAPVHREGLHVDPLILMANVVIDGTGHDCEVVRTLERKNNVSLNTTSGKVMGERSLSVEEAERTTLENTKEVYPGLYITGMAANGVCGSFRMGPIFGGMLFSGKKVADLILSKQ
ncbi:MAG: sulfide-dependent adenosine diphosphate thiazole synthase [Bacteroidales bacterium]|nr:sulfide-dependent adenosine diphosphate thiazole synthase [Bacteroidales bacterium]